MPCAEYELVARVGKARGLEGEVTATTAGDLPFSIYEGLHVYVVPPSLYGERELTVATVEEGSGSTFRLTFEEIDTIDGAEQLAGRFLLADESDLKILDNGSAITDIGRQVLDDRYGELGEITGVIETPANDVWIVQGEHGEVLIPVIDEVIIDRTAGSGRTIRTHIMDGLIGS